MSTFNPTRVWQVLRLQVMLHGRWILMYFGPMLAITFINAVHIDSDVRTGDNETMFAELYAFFLLVGGFIWAAGSLPENVTPDGRQSFLTLPAGDTEKWAAIYLYSGPVFYLAFTLGFWILSLIVTAVTSAFDLVELTPFNPLDASLHDDLRFYFLIVQPLGFLAAICFNKASAVKTVGVGLAALLALGIVTVLAFRLVFHDHISGFFTFDGDADFGVGGPFAFDSDEAPAWLAFAIGVYALAVAYFRFHEKEV